MRTHTSPLQILETDTMWRIEPITPPPASLVQFVQSVPPLNYEDIPGRVKADLRQRLFDEQNGRCAYCERTLRLERTKLEHFHPQSASVASVTPACHARTNEPDLSRADVSIKNMLLCCPGDETIGRHGATTCDTRKGDEHICERIHSPKHLPASAASIIRVDQSGVAVPEVFPGSAEDAIEVIDVVLNLNSDRLRTHRRQVFGETLIAFRRALERNRGRRPAASLRQDAAAKLRDRAEVEPFASTLESVARIIEA